MARIKPAFPAVTCTAQSDYLTGQYPDTHGIVGNGWYSREDCEVRFWKQSNRLVQAPKIWDAAARRRSDVHLREPVLVVQHVFDRGLFASRRGRCIRPTAARSPTSTPRRRRCATSCRRSSERFRCSSSGVRGRRSTRRAGSPRPRSGRAEAQPHADAGLPAAPRLQPAARRTGRRGVDGDLRAIDDVAGELIAILRRARRARASCSRSTASCSVSTPVHINRVLRQRGTDRGAARSSDARCSTPARARRSRSPITRSRTST